LTGADLTLFLPAAAITLIAAYLSVRAGATIGAGVVLLVALYLATVTAYIAVPHWALSATILLFAFVPALKVFATPQIGAVKDLVCLAAFTAAALICTFERRMPDRWVSRLVLLLLGLYAINVGHGHSVAWAQGVRLTGEPLLLLLVGFVLPNPRRNLRYALGALVFTACLVAFYGLIQQAVGRWTLVGWGYQFNVQVRTIGSHLRSFGTFDDPFGYAAFLLFAIGVLMFWWRRSWLTWSIAGWLLIGLFFSFVRTGLIELVAFAGLVLVRWRYTTAAAFFVAATLAGALVTLVNTNGTEATTYSVYSSSGQTQQVNRAVLGSGNVILNGRISAWQAAVGDDPFQWFFGRGVGKVGTAAARATYTFSPSQAGGSSDKSQAVDSGYLATVADVGLIGLGVLLGLLGRLLVLARRAAQLDVAAGWVALALLASMMIDALTRASFTGFPTAFLGLLIVGVALAAANDDPRAAGIPILE
jgi:hypothetical protein